MESTNGIVNYFQNFINGRYSLWDQLVDATLSLNKGDVAMKQRNRIYYSPEQKALIWDRYKQGDSLHEIARMFDRYHSSIMPTNMLQEALDLLNAKDTQPHYLWANEKKYQED